MTSSGHKYKYTCVAQKQRTTETPPTMAQVYSAPQPGRWRWGGGGPMAYGWGEDAKGAPRQTPHYMFWFGTVPMHTSTH
eukprot:scaffold11622_cov140-Isochrysis_galbana.AAC.1